MLEMRTLAVLLLASLATFGSAQDKCVFKFEAAPPKGTTCASLKDITAMDKDLTDIKATKMASEIAPAMKKLKDAVKKRVQVEKILAEMTAKVKKMEDNMKKLDNPGAAAAAKPAAGNTGATGGAKPGAAAGAKPGGAAAGAKPGAAKPGAKPATPPKPADPGDDKDCAGLKLKDNSKKTGLASIKPPGQSAAMQVWCNMDIGQEPRGWVVILRRENPTWKAIAGKLKFVSVGTKGVWGVNSNDEIFYREGSGWKPIAGKLKQVSSGHSVWGVNANDDIFIRQGTTWEKIDGLLKFVSVGPAGVWGVNANDEIFYRTGTFGNEASAGSGWEKTDGKLKQISSGDNAVWGVNTNDDIFIREGISSSTPVGTGWRKIPGKLKQVEASPSGEEAWGVNSGDSIFHYGSLDFNKKFADYEKGFGTPSSPNDYWIGLQNLQKITAQDEWQLYVSLTDHDNKEAFAKYKKFKVSGADYKLTIEGFDILSTAGDGLTDSNGVGFSANDKDNDGSKTSECGKQYQSGWWFNQFCPNPANLNGKYHKKGDPFDSRGIFWREWRQNKNLKKAVMMLQRKRGAKPASG
uniref:Fibrinogen C-terminal domain-containing protein n=1 Tax=Branchiostoma floridae TaxID=7739 RepID=C3Z0X0_BRAFL|eukprot:XP_002597862.1 hypothetical protein BRAFLDRAFT_105468 [Branchiostoma floridae]